MGQEQSKASAYNCASAAARAAAPQDKLAAGAGWVPGSSGGKTGPISASHRKRGKQVGGQESSEHVRKLSIVSNRNIQLLSMKPRSERDNYADGLRARRRSSLINLILGAPSSGPRFSDDLCSLGSHMSFGIDYFPDAAGPQPSPATNNPTKCSLVRLEAGRRTRPDQLQLQLQPEVADSFVGGHRRRRSSLGSLASSLEAGYVWQAMSIQEKTTHLPLDGHSQGVNGLDEGHSPAPLPQSGPLGGRAPKRQLARRCPSLSSIFMASIDLTNQPHEQEGAQKGHFSEGSNSIGGGASESEQAMAPTRMLAESSLSTFGKHMGACQESDQGLARRPSEARAQVAAHRARINLQATSTTNTPLRMLHRSGSELLLYSSAGSTSSASATSSDQRHQFDLRNPPPEHAGSLFHRAAYCGGGAGSSSSSLDRNSLASLKLPAKRKLINPDNEQPPNALARETKLIIMLQVCLPFILAGFGNMAAGLVLNKLAHWQAFQEVPIFFVLLPSFVGMKGNLEMTLASRISTLANLNLLTSGHQRRHAYLSNLILILSQAMGLSLFAVVASMLCHFFTSNLELSLAQTIQLTSLVVLPAALITATVLVFVSSIVMSWSICLANWIQVNPDNLSTLLAAMYGDVSCVLTYGLFAELMYSLRQRNVLIWPLLIICIALASWPLLWYMAYKYTETRELALSSMPPMLAGIVVSLGSGTVLSLVVGRYSRIALYQPVVNGFGANLIAVQASRVSTWLWCSALRRMSATNSHSSLDILDSKQRPTEKKLPSAASRLFNMTGQPARKLNLIGAHSKSTGQDVVVGGGGGGGGGGKEKLTHLKRAYRLTASKVSRALGLVPKAMKVVLWSFVNPSPNSVAARLLLIMLLPAHTLYFFVIWMLSAGYVLLTWPFYAVYMSLCLTQVFILLLICEPLMTLLMRRHLDPDIFGISILMALADLVGTLCLTGAFWLLARLADPNAA